MSATATIKTAEATTNITHTMLPDVAAALGFVRDGVLTGILRHGALQRPLHAIDDGSETSTENPTWWPTDHRRIPDYRPARYHPQWNRLTSSTREAFMIVMMFRGCNVLRVSSHMHPVRDSPLTCFSGPTGFPGGSGLTIAIGHTESQGSGENETTA